MIAVIVRLVIEGLVGMIDVVLKVVPVIVELEEFGIADVRFQEPLDLASSKIQDLKREFGSELFV